MIFEIILNADAMMTGASGGRTVGEGLRCSVTITPLLEILGSV